MNRQVIVLTDARAKPARELFEILSAADISFLTEDWHEGRSATSNESSPNSYQPLAVIYEVRADSNAEELALVIRRVTAEWTSVPVVACRVEPTGRLRLGVSPPTTAQLKRLGFRAIADSPAQLPALLRQVEDIPGTGELKLPDSFKSIPESNAFSLPAQARSEDLRAAFGLLASLHLASNQKEAAQSAVVGVSRLINANRWSIFLVSQASTENLTFAPLASGDVSANGELAFDEELRDELLDGFAPPVEAETRATREAAAIMKAVRTSENGRRVMAVPLISGERVLGVLEGVRSSADRRSFSRSETALIEALAISIAAALANSVRIAEAERLSLTDDLTRLHNARYLRQFLVNEIKRARRYSSSVAAVFLDLDDFKLVNDQHGHLVGSHVLMEVAALLLPSVRDTDCVVRYGGDEFLLILPDARLDDAIQVAERTRAKIERHRFNGGRRLKISLTASLGVAAFPQHALSPQQLIACADRAMYHAKAANKNCVWVVNESTIAQASDHPDTNPTVPAQFQRIPDEKLIS